MTFGDFLGYNLLFIFLGIYTSVVVTGVLDIFYYVFYYPKRSQI